jgi:hypothetical protein
LNPSVTMLVGAVPGVPVMVVNVGEPGVMSWVRRSVVLSVTYRKSPATATRMLFDVAPPVSLSATALSRLIWSWVNTSSPRERRKRYGSDFCGRSKWVWPAPTCQDSIVRPQKPSGLRVPRPGESRSSKAPRWRGTDLNRSSPFSWSMLKPTPSSVQG